VLNSVPAGDDHPFTPPDTDLVAERHIFDLDGVPAQNNANPPGIFRNHFITWYAGEYYDPSYGEGPFLSNGMAHENASIDALYNEERYNEIVPITIFSILVADIQNPNVPELVYFPMPGY
jgi:hypothetical protein